MQQQSASGRARRIVLGCAAGITVALGLGVRLLGEGTWIGPVGDALYAVLIYCLVGVLMPRSAKVRIAVAAFVVCGLIEVSHLTGLPAQWAQHWPAVRWILGSAFGWIDLVAYATGATGAAVIDRTGSQLVSVAGVSR